MLTSSQAPESEHKKPRIHSYHVQNGDRNSTDCENVTDVFRWSRCKRIYPEKTMRSIGIPLPMEHVEVGGWFPSTAKTTPNNYFLLDMVNWVYYDFFS